jgi:acetyl-CoA carboxylase biotin carboxyl carrier protein
MEGAHDEGGSLLDPVLLGRVLDQLESNGVDELEIADGNSRLFIRRAPQVKPSTHAAHRLDREPVGIPINAPLTGVFFSRSAPEQPPYVQVGSKIHVDDVVALIETMKLFNEVKSDVAGTVTQVLAHDNELVEAGQPLMHVEAFSEEEAGAMAPPIESQFPAS